MRFRKGRRGGGTAIEFALTFPVFFMVLSGIIDVSWLSFTRAAMDSAAQLGCREGSTVDAGNGSAYIALVYAETEAAILEVLEVSRVDTSRANVVVEATYDVPQRSLKCTLGYSYQPLIGYVMPSIDLETITVVRMEHQR